MLGFSDLELAALRAVFDESPEIAGLLRHQLETASVIARENTGGGFMTTMKVPDGVRKVSSRTVLGCETEASIDGLAHGLGFVLLMKEGRLHVLDGHSKGGEDTAAVDFERVGYRIGRTSLKD